MQLWVCDLLDDWEIWTISGSGITSGIDTNLSLPLTWTSPLENRLRSALKLK
jgi:hypothetical protein